MDTPAKKIIIYGVPGSGKTKLARRLAKKYGIPHVEADGLRKVAQRGKIVPKAPFHFLSTTEAYQAIGKQNKRNIITGLLGVRNALYPTIAKHLKKCHHGFVLEAAFLDPRRLLKVGDIILLAPSVKDHRRQFFIHRKRDAFHKSQFRNARIIQQYLIAEAQRLDIPVSRNGNRI
jgi:2-phosphoglycerate kinase